MTTHHFKPNSRYLWKLILSFTLLALIVLAGVFLFSWLIAMDSQEAGRITLLILTFLVLVLWIIAILLCGPYYRSLSYHIREDEVIVEVGIITHSIKHVPYRTITNLSVNRDIFDRWFFKLGSINIQTAGMSGKEGAEEKLVGLENVDDVYQLVANELQRFRGGLSATQTETESLTEDRITEALLEEVQQIRKLLEKKK